MALLKECFLYPGWCMLLPVNMSPNIFPGRKQQDPKGEACASSQESLSSPSMQELQQEHSTHSWNL